MKRRIILGLAVIFVVVLVGGGLMSRLMNQLTTLNEARQEIRQADHDLADVLTGVLQVRQRLDALQEDPTSLQGFIGQMDMVNDRLAGFDKVLGSGTFARTSCGLCHPHAEDLVAELHRSLVAVEETVSEVGMVSSVLVTGGNHIDRRKVIGELNSRVGDVQVQMKGISSTLTPMIGHIEEEVAGKLVRINRTQNATLILTTLLVLACVLIVISAVTYPVRLLSRGTEAIVKGDYDSRIDLPGSDEMSLLAERFNYMAEVLANREKRLQQKKLELEDLNETLERKVRERTQTLREKQDELNRKYLEVEAANEELQASYIQLQATAADLEEAQAKLQENFDVLKGMNEDLKRANEVKNKFLSIMSHELRTPLTVINGYLSLVLDKDYGSPGKELRDILMVVKDQGMSQLGLIEDLLDLTRIESGEFKLYRQPCEPGGIVARAVENFRPRLQEKDITVTVQVTERLPLAYWDPQKMLQVFQNLLDNALKFTPAGGWIAIGILSKTDFIEVTVADNGIGIPKDRLEQIFERFYQVDSSSTRKYGGSGLGLSIVKEIVVAHGGKIFVRSDEGKGSVFQLLLPIGEPDRLLRSAGQGEEGLSAAHKAATPQGSGETILVVDDDESFLLMMRKMLPQAGYRVRATSDPASVPDLVRAQGIDLLLADLMMPGLDGYELCRRVRGIPDTARLPILVVSASGGSEVAKKAREAGADDHITKPFDNNDLLARIARLLQEGSTGGVPGGEGEGEAPIGMA